MRAPKLRKRPRPCPISGVCAKYVYVCLEATASEFGWYIAGPAALDVEYQPFSTTVNEDMDLCQQLQKFWYLEEIEIPKSQLESDVYCEEFYTRTTYRGEDKKYAVRLPFKQQYPQDISLIFHRSTRI